MTAIEETALNLAEARAVLVAAATGRAERAEMALTEWKSRCEDAERRAAEAGAAAREQQHYNQFWLEKEAGWQCMAAEAAERRAAKVKAEARELKQHYNLAIEERNAWAQEASEQRVAKVAAEAAEAEALAKAAGAARGQLAAERKLARERARRLPEQP